jgi:hypothetical protein
VDGLAPSRENSLPSSSNGFGFASFPHSWNLLHRDPSIK